MLGPMYDRRNFLRSVTSAGSAVALAPTNFRSRSADQADYRERRRRPIPNSLAGQEWQPQSTCRAEPRAFAHLRLQGASRRSSTFTGVGTDNKGNRIAFGSPTTDYGVMQGEYWAARSAQHGSFTHI